MTVSIPVSTCPSCGAVANPRWVECLACDAPLVGSPRPKASAENFLTSKARTDSKGKGSSPSADRNTPPQDWAVAASNLQAMNCPATESEERWQQVQSDAARLLDWVPAFEAFGWTVENVFGRDDFDRQSLAWKVRGERIELVGKVAAVLRGADESTAYAYRRDSEPVSPSSPEPDRPAAKTWDSETVALIEWFLYQTAMSKTHRSL